MWDPSVSGNQSVSQLVSVCLCPVRSKIEENPWVAFQKHIVNKNRKKRGRHGTRHDEPVVQHPNMLN